MREPLLSIVIVSYEDSSLFLQRVIQSVYEQSYDNCEMILVDANDPESAYSLGLREDMEHYPDICLISCPCRKESFAAAKNAGAQQAGGTYLAFLMPGDVWNHEFASSQIEVLEERPEVALVFCNRGMSEEDVLDTEYRKTPESVAGMEDLDDVFQKEIVGSVSQMMFRRSCFEDVHGFDTRIYKKDDYDLWIRIMKKYKIAAVSQNLVCSYVEKSVLKKSHELIDVVGYLQLYSKHQDFYKKNDGARMELFRNIAGCYRQSHRYIAWMKFNRKRKLLERKMRKRPKNLTENQISQQIQSKENTAGYDLISSEEKECIAVINQIFDSSMGRCVPLAGAQFQLYLKSAGSFEEAKSSEKDLLVCDEEGYASSKKLSEGIYILHQKSGCAYAQKTEDFEISLGNQGKTHRILVTSTPVSFHLKLNNLDAETGRAIAGACGGFRIYDENSQPVFMECTYPEYKVMDTYYTGERGFFITPQKLIFGNYSVEEIRAPFGYVLNADRISFTVNKETCEWYENMPVINVNIENIPQKGTICIHKTAPAFSTAELTDEGIYNVHYENVDICGTEFEIIADEDIVTPDGTVRVPENSVAAVVKTDETGTAVSGELYLGKYRIQEKNASYGMVRSKEVQYVTLCCSDRDISVTEASVHFQGTRQKGIIFLEKTLCHRPEFPTEKEISFRDFVFGIYTDSELSMSDGSMIPKDALVAMIRCDENGIAQSEWELPFGSYYVKELQSNPYYKLSGEKYPFVFSYGDQDLMEVKLFVNDGQAIASHMIEGNICGKVVSRKLKPVAGAAVGLFPLDTGEFLKENALRVSVTDPDGNYAFEHMQCGDYMIRQLSAPDGYTANAAIHFVSLTYDGQMIALRIINEQSFEKRKGWLI